MFLFLLPFVLIVNPIYAKFSENIAFNGYIIESPLYWKPPKFLTDSDDFRFDNLIHARQNAKWFVNNELTLSLELKSKLLLGQSVDLLASSTSYESESKALLNWQRAFVKDNSVDFWGGIDRLWIDYSTVLYQLTVGKQRIAWGTNLIWNPIDIFNPSSPFDFDNIEKSGTEAARLQIYPGPSSKIELAFTANKKIDKTTAALKIKTNHLGYDLILMGGRKASLTFAGVGWAGSIFGGGFRGELLFAMPRLSNPENNPFSTVSISGDYTFRNSLYLHSGFIYNEKGTTGKAGGDELINSMLDGFLTSARWSTYFQLAKNITPLYRIDYFHILNPHDKSLYSSPTLTWSARANLDAAFSAMFFEGNDGTEFGDNGTLFMLRIKYAY